MINSQKLAYSAGANDECYTPAYFVELILPHIPAGAVVWCPFDTPESEFVKLISKTNKVIHSHISEGKDFYQYEPNEHWDILISNPPFTGKAKIFERALSFGKPFALVMTATWFNDATPVNLFVNAGREMQLLLTNKRVDYQGTGKTTFMSCYICADLLPNSIVMQLLRETRKRKKYVDCEKCGSKNSVFFDANLPSICEACLPDYMCESCGSFELMYEGNKANGTWYKCKSCRHPQQKRQKD